METYTCCICKKTFIGYGNNPYPVDKTEGARCCNQCNEFVIAKRILLLNTEKEKQNG